MHANMESLRDPLKRLEGHVRRAKNLTLLPEDFGIKKVRTAITAKDAKKFDIALGELLNNVGANIAALNEKGFIQDAKTFIISAKQSVKEVNELQNIKLNGKNNLAKANIEGLNDLRDNKYDILETGKILFKNKNKSKTDEFPLAVLKKRVRRERKEKGTLPEEEGTTTQV